MLNQCNFIGRTGKDVELRYTPNGDAVANVSLAVSETWKDKSGQKQERTEWVNLVAWRQLAEIMGKYVTKGNLIFVSGKLQTRTYDDRDGNKRYQTELVVDTMKMLGGKEGQGQGGERGSQGQSRNENTGGGGYVEPPFNPDDEIPFKSPPWYR